MARAHYPMKIRDPALWQQILTVVDLSGVSGALGFYVAEAIDEKTIELRHRDGSQRSIVIDAKTFGERYQAGCETSARPGSTGLIFDVLRTMLPPLCEACGHVLPAGSCCTACQKRQIDDLLRMADPWVNAP